MRGIGHGGRLSLGDVDDQIRRAVALCCYSLLRQGLLEYSQSGQGGWFGGKFSLWFRTR